MVARVAHVRGTAFAPAVRSQVRYSVPVFRDMSPHA
jgi:hypothetical protein